MRRRLRPAVGRLGAVQTWDQHRVMSRRSGIGMSGSILGRSPYIATCVQQQFPLHASQYSTGPARQTVITAGLAAATTCSCGVV